MMFENIELPELRGSKKQIAWAESIRERFMKEARKAEEDISFFLEKECDAKTYIDYREVNILAFEKPYRLYTTYFNFELPELEGSEKQISWGESIREEMLEKIKMMAEEKEIMSLVELFKQKTDSTYFIANKGCSYKELKALAFAFTEANRVEPLLPALEGDIKKLANANKKRRNALERDYKAFYMGDMGCSEEDIFELHMSNTKIDDYKI